MGVGDYANLYATARIRMEQHIDILVLVALLGPLAGLRGSIDVS